MKRYAIAIAFMFVAFVAIVTLFASTGAAFRSI